MKQGASPATETVFIMQGDFPAVKATGWLTMQFFIKQQHSANLTRFRLYGSIYLMQVLIYIPALFTTAPELAPCRSCC